MTAITEPEPATRVPPSGDSALTVRNLWKIFGKGSDRVIGTADADLSRADLKEKTGCVVGVKDVSFDVAPGEVFVVMGLSGSGKSTLVRLLTRLIEPTSGEVVMDGLDIVKASESELRDLRRTHTSMVFQHFGLLPHRQVHRQRRLRPRGAWHRQEGAPGQGAARSSSWWASRATRSPTPTSSPAACSSASAWPARWPTTRRCCSSTSRSRRSTR